MLSDPGWGLVLYVMYSKLKRWRETANYSLNTITPEI